MGGLDGVVGSSGWIEWLAMPTRDRPLADMCPRGLPTVREHVSGSACAWRERSSFSPGFGRLSGYRGSFSPCVESYCEASANPPRWRGGRWTAGFDEWPGVTLRARGEALLEAALEADARQDDRA